jgi:DNA-binding CsgD family transcriptional regulator
VLTAREAEIALLAEQHSNQDIAAQLGLSVRTVESHISNGLRKAGASTRQQLAEMARRTGGTPPPAAPPRARLET